MITNKTPNFVKLRGSQFFRNPQILSVSCIREAMENLKKQMGSLQKVLNKSTLPTFNKANRATEEIEEFKNKIDRQLQEIKNAIKTVKEEILLNKSPQFKMLSELIEDYFNVDLQRLVSIYTTILQGHSKKTTTIEIFSEIAQNSNENLLNIVQKSNAQQGAFETETNILGINQSLAEITNVLMELQINVKKQTFMIDSIDRYFESANRYLAEANKEISLIPKKYIKLKDRIIWMMINVIIALLILVSYKEYRKPKKIN